MFGWDSASLSFVRPPLYLPNHAYFLWAKSFFWSVHKGSSAEEPDLGQTGEGSGRPAIVVDRVPLVGPPSSSSKGKSKVSEIRYPGGSYYLRAVVQNAEAVGPSRIEPFFWKDLRRLL